MHPNVKRLIELEYAEQRSEEWLKLRGNLLTASDAATAIGVNKYETPAKLLLKKCGMAEPFRGNEATAWGTMMEPVALEMFEERYNEKVYELGLVPHPIYNFLGGSPDGLTESNCLVEIKCPMMRKIIPGEVPVHYMPQLQLCMDIMDLESCFLYNMLPSKKLGHHLKCLMLPLFPVIVNGLRPTSRLCEHFGTRFYTSESTWMSCLNPKKR